MTKNALQSAKWRNRCVMLLAAIVLTTAAAGKSAQAQAASPPPLATLQFDAKGMDSNNSTLVRRSRFRPLRSYAALSPQVRSFLNLSLFGGLGLLASLRPFDGRIRRAKQDS